MKFFLPSSKSPSLRAACGEAIQIRKEKANTQIRPYNFQIPVIASRLRRSNPGTESHGLLRAVALAMTMILLLSTSSLRAEIIWNATGNSADDVNVGSSADSYIEINFYTTEAITNCLVDIAMPATYGNNESFNVAGITAEAGNTATLTSTSPPNNRTLRLHFVSIDIGVTVHYKIPHHPSGQHNTIIPSQNITVNVYKNNSTSAGNTLTVTPKTLPYNYRYAKLRIIDPEFPVLNQSSPLKMDFHSNNAVHDESGYDFQTFRFQLWSNDGATDSATFTMTFPYRHITLKDWKIGASQLAIPASQISVSTPVTNSLTTTYTIKLRKQDFPGGNGIAFDEQIPVFVDVRKETCGITNITYATTWATQINVRNATNVSNIPGTFEADPGDGTLPGLVAADNHSWINHNGGTMLCMNGSADNEITVALTNQGAGQARNMRLRLDTQAPDAIQGRSCFMDTASLRIKKGYDGAWEHPEIISVVSVYNSIRSEYRPCLNPLYTDNPASVTFDVRPYLSGNKADTLYISCKFTMPADFYLYSPGISNAANTPPYYFRGFTLHVVSGTGAGGEATAQTVPLYNELGGSMNLGMGLRNNYSGSSTPINFLTAYAVDTLFMTMDIGPFGTLPHLASNDAKVSFRIALPKGLNLKQHTIDDIQVYYYYSKLYKWPVQDFSYASNATMDSMICTFSLYKSEVQLVNGTLYTIGITLQNTCEEGKNQIVQPEVRMFMYPTGTETPGSCSDVVYDGMQVYPLAKLMCQPEHVTFTTDLRRITVGLQDNDNDGIPDPGNLPADPDKINHHLLLPNDTAHFTWEAEMLENNDTTLYAVLLSSFNADYMGVNASTKTLTLNGTADLLRDTLINSIYTTPAYRAGYATHYDRGTSVPAAERYVYVWEINKKDGEPFSSGDDILFTVELRGMAGSDGYGQYNSINSSVTAWLYATETSLIKDLSSLNDCMNQALNPGNARRGDESYATDLNCAGLYMGAPYMNLTFDAVEEKAFTGTLLDIWTTYNGSTLRYPSEYRHLTTLDSVVLQIPEGYEFPTDNAKFQITYYDNITGAVKSTKDTILTASATAVNTPEQKTFVFGDLVFDVNRDGSTGFPLPHGRYKVEVADIKIASTYRSPIGQTFGKFTVYSDNHTCTQAYVPRLQKQSAGVDYVIQHVYGANSNYLSFTDPGYIQITPYGGIPVSNATSSDVQWRVILNPSPNDAVGAWLYVQGDVTDARIISGGQTYQGEGEGKRWIPLPPTFTAGNTDIDTLIVHYEGTACTDLPLSVYPVYDPQNTTNTLWRPDTDGGLTMTDVGFTAAMNPQHASRKYIRHNGKRDLTIHNVDVYFSGRITSLATSPVDPENPGTSAPYGSSDITVWQRFPVEIALNTTASQSSVVDTKIKLHIPAGLQYVEDSTYMELSGVNYKVTTGSLLDVLRTLNGDASPKDITLELSGAGITELGNGEIPPNETTWLRFMLKPVCDIDQNSPRISAVFSGKKVCGDIIPEGLPQYSSHLTLTGKQANYNILMQKPLISKADFICETSGMATMAFQLKSTPTTLIGALDSLRLAVPKAIDLDGTYGSPISYSLPQGVSGATSAESGSYTTAQINNRIEGDMRFLTWPMPYTYFNALAANSEALQSINNTYTIQLAFEKPDKYFNDSLRTAIVTTFTISEGCPSVSGEMFPGRAHVITRADHTTWTGGNNSNDWTDFDNWSDGVPGICSDATIRASGVYPELIDTTRIDSIHFDAHTEIGKVPWLNYNKATADLEILSNQWYLLSAPLKDMYSGDYILYHNNSFVPITYMCMYQSEDHWTGAEKKVAEWTAAFGAANVPLNPGSGYAVWVDRDPTGTRVPFDFPKDSMSYVIYNQQGTAIIWTDHISAGGRDNNRRFIYDDKFSQTAGKNAREFDLPVENGTETTYTNLLIANPFMSHLDFTAFYNANSGKIQNKYYVWGGSSFKAIDHIVQNESEQYIAPQQSFVVLRNDATLVPDLHFTPAMSIAPLGAATLKRATLERPARLQLKVYKYDKLQSEAEIRYKRGASNSFDESEDAWTLFSNSVKKAAVVYSKIDNAAASINMLGNVSEDIPLGIRTSEASELKFVIEGAETFDGEVYLVDVAQGREINLAENPDYTFQNNTGDIPDRFYIRIREAATSIYKGTAAPDIRIYQENGTVHITSASDDPLRSVEISNAQGQIIAKREGVSSSISIPIPTGNQVVVVKAVSERSHAVRKVRGN